MATPAVQVEACFSVYFSIIIISLPLERYIQYFITIVFD